MLYETIRRMFVFIGFMAKRKRETDGIALEYLFNNEFKNST